MGKSLKVAALIAVILPTSLSPALADYEAGVLAQKSGNQAEARRQWETSAKLGESRSQRALGQMLMDGRWAVQDYVAAHMWLNLAAGGGEAKAASERDALAQRMSREQVAEAQRLAAAFKPGVKPNENELNAGPTVAAAPRLPVTVEAPSAKTESKPDTVQHGFLSGVWMDAKNGLIISIERAANGGFVMKQALTADKYSHPGDVIGEFEPDPANPETYQGRHLWGGKRTGDAEWGIDGGMVVRKVNSRRLFVQYTDSKYQGGWTYDRIN